MRDEPMREGASGWGRASYRQRDSEDLTYAAGTIARKRWGTDTGEERPQGDFDAIDVCGASTVRAWQRSGCLVRLGLFPAGHQGFRFGDFYAELMRDFLRSLAMQPEVACPLDLLAGEASGTKILPAASSTGLTRLLVR